MTLPYFPFYGQPYAMTMGTHFLASGRIIEIDPPKYRSELALKADILAGDADYYVQALPATEALAWDALALVLPVMAQHEPASFRLEISGDCWRWTNCLLDEGTTFTLGDAATLPRPPLDWLGRQVQEDLLLLDGVTPGTPLVAGHLCFAAGWCLDDKLGQSFLTIHDPVPGFRDQIGRSSDLLMQRLKPGRPSERIGWSLTVTEALDRSPRATLDLAPLRAAVRPDNAGQRVYLRLERQTFSRLPATGGVLFTIHTYIAPLDDVLTDRDRLECFAVTLETLPPATQTYKNMTSYRPAVLDYLAERRRLLANS